MSPLMITFTLPYAKRTPFGSTVWHKLRKRLSVLGDYDGLTRVGDLVDQR
jgi:hypothetical protein